MFGGQLGRVGLGEFELGRIPQDDGGHVSLPIAATISASGVYTWHDSTTVDGIGVVTGVEFQTFPSRLVMVGSDLVMIGTNLVVVPAE